MTQRICITERYKYVAALFGDDELYDLREDPFETQNLIESEAHKMIRTDLRKRIADEISRTNDPVSDARLLAYSLNEASKKDN